MPGTRKLGKTTDQRMAMLRQQVTDLLDNGRMAKVPSKVYDLLMSIWTPAVKKAQDEIADMQTLFHLYNQIQPF